MAYPKFSLSLGFLPALALGSYMHTIIPFFPSTKCHQFSLAWGPVQSFTFNSGGKTFFKLLPLNCTDPVTWETQYCLHILLSGIKAVLPELCLSCEGDVCSLFYEISSICGCLNSRKNSCKSKELHKIAITSVELCCVEHNCRQQEVEGTSWFNTRCEKFLALRAEVPCLWWMPTDESMPAPQGWGLVFAPFPSSPCPVTVRPCSKAA